MNRRQALKTGVALAALPALSTLGKEEVVHVGMPESYFSKEQILAEFSVPHNLKASDYEIVIDPGHEVYFVENHVRVADQDVHNAISEALGTMIAGTEEDLKFNDSKRK